MTQRRPGAARTTGGAGPAGWGALRGLVAAAVLLSADVHLVLYVDGYSDIAVIGELFLVNVAAGLVIGLAVLVWRHWLTALAAAGFGAATFAAYLLSRTVGLFGVNEMMWDAQAVLAAVAEIVAVVGGLGLLVVTRPRSGGSREVSGTH